MFTIPKKPKIKLKPQAPDKRQIAVVPLRAIMDKSLSLGALRVLCMVCSYANRSGITWVGQDRLAKDLGVSRRTVTAQMTKLREKKYVERLTKGAKMSHTSTMRIVYNEEIGLTEALARNTEDGRSPYMILKEEREMAKKAPKSTPKTIKTLGEYVDTKTAEKPNSEAILAYISKFEIVEDLYWKIYKEKKVINELDMKAIEMTDSIGLANDEFGRGLELWLRARDQAPGSIIDYVRGL
jgi:DNA-binding transcriptional ArsR family regulator